MVMNKKGAKDGMSTILIVLLIVGAAYFFIPSFQTTVNGFFGKSTTVDSNVPVGEPTEDSSKNCPTTGITTLTLNVQDELATTATNVNAEYYVFNGNKLITDGSTGSDGSVSVDLSCGKDYKILLMNGTNTAASGAYSKVIDFAARTAAQTVNEKLILLGNAQIVGIENPADPAGNGNATLVANGIANFNLKMKANYSGYGFNRPIIMCQSNVTEVQDITISSFSDGSNVVKVTSLPKRISAQSGWSYYAYEYPKTLIPKLGVIIASGVVTAGSTAPSQTEANGMNCTLVDQATWKTSEYKTSSSIDEGFKTGPENTETNADVGAPDATEGEFSFYNSGGY